MKSRVHPKYKTRYHVHNWASYERGLVRRGDLTVWLSAEAIAGWTPDGTGKRGGQRQYSDVAIETAWTLRLMFHLPLRQLEGFLTSVFALMGVDLRAPDHTTLSRRGQRLNVRLRHGSRARRMHLLIDSTGLSIFGEGEWAAANHGGQGKRGWKKLHLGVDRSGVIVAQVLTDATADDAVTGASLLEAVDGSVTSVTADAAYDTIAFYKAAANRGARVVVPPVKMARLSRRGPRSRARDRTIRQIFLTTSRDATAADCSGVRSSGRRMVPLSLKRHRMSKNASRRSSSRTRSADRPARSSCIALPFATACATSTFFNNR